MSKIKKSGKDDMYVLLGETGVPFNMGREFDNIEYTEEEEESDNEDEPDDEYVQPTKAIDRTIRALEANNLDVTLWNYCHDNTWIGGDHWNGEDFSIRSMSGEKKNRGLLAVVRPFAVRVGVHLAVLSQRFDPSTRTKRFELTVRCMDSPKGRDNYGGGGPNDLVVYLPQIHFFVPNVVTITSGKYEFNLDEQLLIWRGITSNDRKGGYLSKLVIENNFRSDDNNTRLENGGFDDNLDV